MDVHQDIKARKTLTHDAGLGIGGRRLHDGGLTLRGGESNLSGDKGELQLPRLMGSHRKSPMSFVRLVDESAKLLTATRRRRRRARPRRWRDLS